MDKNRYAEKLCEFFYNSRGRRIESDYERFYRYVSKHSKKNVVLYAEWLTADNLIISSVSAFFDSFSNSVTKINRESI